MKRLYINRTGDTKYFLHNQEFEVLTVLLPGFNIKIKEYRSYSVASYHREKMGLSAAGFYVGSPFGRESPFYLQPMI